MRRTIIPLLLLVLAWAASVQAMPGAKRTGQQNAMAGPRTIVRLDPRLDRLISRGAALEKLADGFAWVEGPVWNRQEGFLLFSDMPMVGSIT